jgi:hypothetical protein
MRNRWDTVASSYNTWPSSLLILDRTATHPTRCLSSIVCWGVLCHGWGVATVRCRGVLTLVNPTPSRISSGRGLL